MIKKISLYFYAILILIFIIESSYFTYSQYAVWKSHPVSQYLLPPHQNINYFLQYSFYRFWSHFLAALIFSLVILFLAKYFNKRRNYQYFYDEEPYFIAIAILLVGYPGWLVYLTLMLLVPILWSGAFASWKWMQGFFESGLRNQELGSIFFPRISYYYLWLILAVFAIIVSKYLENFPFWSKFII